MTSPASSPSPEVAYATAPQLHLEGDDLVRLRRSMPKREWLLRWAALTDRQTLTAHPDDGKAQTGALRTIQKLGWNCSAQGCPVRMDGYGDQRASRKDAADHERRQAVALFEPGTLVVSVGPGGSGKSRFAAMFPSDWVVCLDELRERVSGDAGDQSATPDAVALQDLLIPARLARGHTTIVDSTNVEARVRRGLVDQARQHGRPVAAVVFLTDLDFFGGSEPVA